MGIDNLNPWIYNSDNKTNKVCQLPTREHLYNSIAVSRMDKILMQVS